VQTTQFSRTVGDAVSGNITYKLPWRTATTLQFENNQTLRDLGPQSTASLTDRRKRVALTASHSFSKTLSLDISGSSQIQQTFYLRYAENPGDRDQVDTSANVTLTSQPFKKISASIRFAYSVSNIVNVDSTQSGNNRTRELWELRPTFTYVMNPHLTILQSYGLAFEYTDYDFEADQNFLDRNLTFTNEFQYHPTKPIDFRFKYELYLHDSGSYLPDPTTGVRYLDVNSEDRRDRTTLSIDYKAAKHINFFAENVYSHREEGAPGSDDKSSQADGQITVGSAANYDWKSGRILKFRVARVKRFSSFGVDAEKNYWNATSEFAYPF
jgi:hypothetical protein